MRVKLIGDKELRVKLRECQNLDAVRTIVHKNGDEMNARMKKNTETAFVKGYSMGDTARSINTILRDGGLTADVGPTREYAEYVEYGTRFMEAEPFIKPAFEVQKEKFLEDLRRVCD